MMTREEVKRKVVKAISTTSQHWHFNGKFFYTTYVANFDRGVSVSLELQMRYDHLILTVNSLCLIEIGVSQEFRGEDAFEQGVEWLTDYILTVCARLNQHAERLAELLDGRNRRNAEYYRFLRSVLPQAQ